jgi:flagellar basal body-associated protein FliL
VVVKDNRKIFILIGVMVFAIVLSAIFMVNIRGPEVKEQSIEETTEASSVGDFTPENTEVAEVSSVEATSESPKDNQDAGAAVPTARAGLESTNPATVKLASGDIQLIELFAFW